ncbi:MAG: GNAT family N-acetyltransferase [Planctomycetaceae bacterium]|nr:GNAT family N-acetyltransferase [Planctomycetaceae bacterium]
MIRIVRIYRTVLPIEKERIAQVQEIFRQHFGAVADYADKLPELLDNPIKYGYTSVLLVSETTLGQVTGFSLFFYFPNVRSAYLDFLAVRKDIRGGGTGSALYEATRQYCQEMNCHGLFLESLSADAALVKDPAVLKENQGRLRFYENYGARPIINTAYETPVGNYPAPHLLYDDLDSHHPLGRSQCRAVMRTILEKKYSHLVTPDYIERVVRSVVDDPVRIRPPKYIKSEPAEAPGDHSRRRLQKPFVMVSGTAHAIHHVRERGYVERPARVKAIQSVLDQTGLFRTASPRHFGQEHVTAVHDTDFVRYLKTVCQKLQSRRPVYPYVFPIRRPERKPRELAVRAGYYCIDTFTPLDKNAFKAARAAVDVALSSADELLLGASPVYALCRPPGHHAERKTFGGFCYFNNTAIAANYLSRHGKVAVLDIDFHHGNGTQDIFYARRDVLTCSIHGHPNFAYPYFSGFADETGEGPGKGFNHNFCLQDNAGPAIYLATLEKALAQVHRFQPLFLVLALGFDTMRGDPTGSFDLQPETMRKIGAAVASMNLPTLVVQEGGYSLKNLKSGSVALFRGFSDVLHQKEKLKINGNGK